MNNFLFVLEPGSEPFVVGLMIMLKLAIFVAVVYAVFRVVKLMKRKYLS